FIGKGGVGKTTLAAAFAVHSAAERSTRQVLLISTDPAHSLADVLEKKLGHRPRRIRLPRGRSLTVWEMNPAKQFHRFLRKHRRELVRLIEQGSLFTAAEISALLDTTLPGMSEIAALMAIEDALRSGQYSRIVVDTAPFGHTLRLFDLPRQFLHLIRFLELSGQRDRVLAEHFGGAIADRRSSFVTHWREQVERCQQAFSAASLVLVTTLESFALNESVRCLRELRKSIPQLAVRNVVLNRVVRHPGRCSECRRRSQLLGPAEVLVRREFKPARVYMAEDPGTPILGTRQLKRFAAHVFARKPLKWAPSPTERARPVVRTVEWPHLDCPLSFVLGKGGVGKTTVSAGLAQHWRSCSRESVHVCSVDPAPSLDDIFQTAVGDRPRQVLGDPRFRASEFDSVALFRGWINQIRARLEPAGGSGSSGLELDLSFERRLVSELLEIVPPGLDEMLAISRILEMRRGPANKLIIDMAPTGHALELLAMPERVLVWTRLLLKSLAAHRKLALAREAAVKIAELEVDARELSRALKSSKRARFFSVMLPEPLPDRETERMLGALRGLGISSAALFVNRVFFSGNLGSCPRCRCAAGWQRKVLARLQRRFHGQPIYAIRNFPQEIAGRAGLRKLTSELWKLS
ncbi:MAG: ArsA family ATPase, partial [Acidobacteria bacterium]|nr:ArsA family ATPase [Acidobacteriota bacterium]